MKFGHFLRHKQLLQATFELSGLEIGHLDAVAPYPIPPPPLLLLADNTKYSSQMSFLVISMEFLMLYICAVVVQW